jgi:hypothetical protein
VLEAIEGTEKALAALPERALSDALKSSALQNLGVAELWSSRFDDARRDLEHALALARHAGRPWLEVPCLGHLGIAGPWTGLTFSEGLELSEEAVRIVDAHGWSEDPVIVTALATRGDRPAVAWAIRRGRAVAGAGGAYVGSGWRAGH